MSESLSIHAIVAHWLRTAMPDGLLVLERNVYLQLSDIILMLQEAGHGVEHVNVGDLAAKIK